MPVPERPTRTTYSRDAMRYLLLTIDEAWASHGDRLMGSACISRAEVGFEDLLFQVSEWAEDLDRPLP